MSARFGSPRPGSAALGRGLLPLRAFLGGAFLYAGFDKLLDPRFFDATSAASIQAQMVVFTRTSPIAPLVRIGQPVAVPIGLAIAIAEIAIGLGALTGLAFRVAAIGGAALSILFFLTASWSTHPFYYGPDLPYAAGWLTLALTGHGGLFVSRRLVRWASGRPPDPSDARPGPTRRDRQVGASAADATDAPLRDRRTVLQAGVLGVLALVAASLAAPFRLSGAVHAPDADEPSASSAASGAPPSPAAVLSGSPGTTASGGIVVAHVSDLARTGAKAFRVPFTAPPPLPAGDPAVVVQLSDGSFVAFDAVCTHAGCTVGWDRHSRVLLCPCHDAAFDPANRAAVLQGPTNEPLASIPIRVDPSTGAISLQA